MHLLNTIPQRLDPGATPTFAGLIAPSLTSPAASPLTLGTGTSGAAITVLSASNNVGVGTTSPTKKLSATGAGTQGSGIVDVLRISRGGINDLNDSTGILFVQRDTNNDYGAAIRATNTQAFGLALNPRLGFFTQNSGDEVLANLVERMSVLTSGNVLIGGTTDISGTGGLKIFGTTAGSAGAGALVVTGGLATGADSYIGGKLTQSVAAGTVIQSLVHTSPTAGVYQEWKTNTTTDRAYVGTGNQVISGGSIADFAINSVTGNVVLGTASAARLTIGSAGATFAGAVTIGNTVNTVSPTSPNRTITMVVNGVTLYIAAKTTND